ncbi:MAG: Ku protein [Parachlamydia sp.]|nr:MAG: Ku protein [Parachlamydia sp.]
MRSLWKGSLSFGLVNIPVQMFTGSQTQELKFTLLHKKDHSQIRYARICKEEEKEVPWSDIVKGYPSEKGDYIVMTDEDIQKAIAEKSNLIEILFFTNQSEIDPIYFEKPYILTPDKSADKSYGLLIEALKKSKKTAVVRYVIHSREHIGALSPYGNFILLNQLRYQSELADLAELKEPSQYKGSPKEVDIAMQLIKHMEKKFNPEEFQDTYVETLKKAIKQKEKGKKVVAPAKGPAPSKKIHDIMSLLKASLDEQEKKPKKRA